MLLVVVLVTGIFCDASTSFFEYKMLEQCINDASQKHDDRYGIYGMHHLKVEARWPVGIFLPEKIHEQI